MRVLAVSLWFLALIPGLVTAQQVTTEIKVVGPAHTPVIRFSGSPRLSQIYNQCQANDIDMQSIYWPGVRLVSGDKHQQIVSQQRALVQRLYQLQRHWREQNSREHAQLAGRIAEQVASWPLVGAEPVGPGYAKTPEAITANVNLAIDSHLSANWDEARININANPAIPAGTATAPARYQLLLPQLAEHAAPSLQVVGAVWVPFKMAYNPALTAREIAQLEQLNKRIETVALNAEVVQVTTDGLTEVVKLDPFNAYSQRFSAGAKVVVLFDESELPDAFQTLNTDMVELVKYWNPLEPELRQYGSYGAVGHYLPDNGELPKRPPLWLGEADKQIQPTVSDFGSIGLLQMPTGRMAEQGEFSFTYFDNEQYRRWAVNLQLFPWLETTLRYNDVRTRLYSGVESFSGDETYKDRGVDVKFRLHEETRWIPEISIGIRDLAGTGLFAGEFVAASKRFGDFDFTLGMGWGYLGNSGNIDNPFCELSDSFCNRGGGWTGEGGNFEIDKWFRGPTALFGGVEYQTPWDPLTIKIEYDGNDYNNEPVETIIHADSQWNLGLNYKVNDIFSVNASYERGNTLMFGFSLRTNFNHLNQPKYDTPKRQPAAPVRQDVSELDDPNTIAKIRNNLYYESGIWAREIVYDPDDKQLKVYGTQTKYRQQELAIERFGRILAEEVPADVETYSFIDDVSTMLMAQTDIDAQTFKTAITRSDIRTTTADSYSRTNPEQIADRDKVFFDSEHEIGMPAFSVKPYLEQSFGGPEAFYMYQVSLDFRAALAVSEKTFFFGTLGTKIVNNYDKFNFKVEAGRPALPRVRTYVREYVTNSDVWLRNLQIVHTGQLGQNWYGMVTAGYFELMFGGVGGEILYREQDSDWAVGVDVNYARQRSFENHLGFRDYDVITGHVTGYWHPDFVEDSLVRLAAGQFLAGDKGLYGSFEHKFDSGIIAGAYAAKTNVSAEEFGEGSFNKGFFISIPFDLLQMRHSTSRGSISWTPLTRDGGQMLRREFGLFGLTDKRRPFFTE